MFLERRYIETAPRRRARPSTDSVAPVLGISEEDLFEEVEFEVCAEVELEVFSLTSEDGVTTTFSDFSELFEVSEFFESSELEVPEVEELETGFRLPDSALLAPADGT